MTGPALWLDRSGKAIDWSTWVSYTQDRHYRELADERVGGCRVRTNWVGIKVPLRMPFETVVQDEEHPGTGMDGLAWRWSSEAEAFAGHRRALELVAVVCVGADQDHETGAD